MEWITERAFFWTNAPGINHLWHHNWWLVVSFVNKWIDLRWGRATRPDRLGLRPPARPESQTAGLFSRPSLLEHMNVLLILYVPTFGPRSPLVPLGPAFPRFPCGWVWWVWWFWWLWHVICMNLLIHAYAELHKLHIICYISYPPSNVTGLPCWSVFTIVSLDKSHKAQRTWICTGRCLTGQGWFAGLQPLFYIFDFFVHF